MLKNLLVDTWTTIKQTKLLFVVLIVCTALMAGLFAAPRFAASALTRAMDGCLDEGHMYDLKVYLPYGVTEAELDALRALPVVDEIEGVRSAEAVIEGSNAPLYIEGTTATMALGGIVEGRLPEEKGDLALLKTTADSLGIKVGDTLTIREMTSQHTGLVDKLLKDNAGNGAISDVIASAAADDRVLKEETFVVTALVTNPAYLKTDEAVGIGYVSPEAFKAFESMDYTDLYIRSDSLRGYSRSGRLYKETALELEAAVRIETSKMTESRYETIAGSGEAAASEGNKTLADEKTGLDKRASSVKEADSALDEERKALATAKTAYDDKKTAYDADAKKLSDDKKLLDDKEKKVKEAGTAVDTLLSELTAKQASLDEAVSAAAEKRRNLEGEESRLGFAQAKIDEAESKISQGKKLLAQAELTLKQLEAAGLGGTKDYRTQYQQYKADKAALEKFEKETATKKSQLSDGVAAAAETRRQVEAAEAELEESKHRMGEDWAGYDDKAAAYKKDLEAYTKDKTAYDEAAKKLEETKKAMDEDSKALEESTKAFDEKDKKQREAAAALERDEKAYDEARAQLDAFEEALAGIESKTCTVTTMADHGGLTIVAAFKALMTKLSWGLMALMAVVTMAAAFVIIRRLFALGLLDENGDALAESFIGNLYSLPATIIGCGIGILAAYFAGEGLCLRSVCEKLVLDTPAPHIQAADCGMILILEMALMILATSTAAALVRKKAS